MLGGVCVPQEDAGEKCVSLRALGGVCVCQDARRKDVPIGTPWEECVSQDAGPSRNILPLVLSSERNVLPAVPSG